MVFVYFGRHNELFPTKSSFYESGSEVKNHQGKLGRNLWWFQVWNKQLIRWLENFIIFNIVSRLLSFQNQEGNDNHHIFAFVVLLLGVRTLWCPALHSILPNRAPLSRTGGETLQNIKQRERERGLESLLVTGLMIKTKLERIIVIVI